MILRLGTLAEREPRPFCCPCGTCSSLGSIDLAAEAAGAVAGGATSGGVAHGTTAHSIIVGVTTGLIVWTITRWLDRR